MAYRGIQATNLISVDAAFDDALLILNKSGVSPTDVGFLGRIGPASYSGLVKDSDTDTFILINSINLSSQSINDISALDASLVKGSLSLNTMTATTVHASETLVLPKGTAAQHPANPVEGQMFFNTETNLFEGYDGTSWIQFLPTTFSMATP